MSNYLARLAEFQIALQRGLPGKESSRDVDGDDDDDDGKREETFIKSTLRGICQVVRSAEASNDIDIETICSRADKLLNRCIEMAYSKETFDYIPSFAHADDDSLSLETTSFEDRLGHLAILEFQGITRMMLGLSKDEPLPERVQDKMLKVPEPWNKTIRPYSGTTPLARFVTGSTPPLATVAHPLASLIYQAKCEVSADRICSPIQLCLSSNSSCLTLISAGGYKNRDPVVSYWRVDVESVGFPDSRDIETGLEDIAYHSAMDEQRKLLYVADDSRIKSFSWASESETPFDSPDGHSGFPIHTMDSRCKGPLHVTDGQVFRAGKGLMEVWKIDMLETHGEDGTQRIGKKMRHNTDTWRDIEDPDEIECSSGTRAHQKVSFDDKKFAPFRWHAHPSSPGSVLCVSDAHETPTYSCVVLQLETGKILSRHLGHSAQVLEISTSETDPHGFVTACSDGYARLYDTRQHLPVLTLDVGLLGSACPAAVICHPDGIPTIFTGSEKHETIKLWDVRARSAVYELATGNNAVVDLSWDSVHNALYAATECNYIDRIGNHHDYRRAKIPKFSAGIPGGTKDNSFRPEDQGDEDNHNDDWNGSDSEDEDDDIAWPKNAFHAENYFGYTFDAGIHQIYRYKFKPDANTDILPPYGDASAYSDEYSW